MTSSPVDIKKMIIEYSDGTKLTVTKIDKDIRSLVVALVSSRTTEWKVEENKWRDRLKNFFKL